MVFLAITSGGLREALQLAAGTPVWCGSDAISEKEFAKYNGGNLTRFIYSLSDASAEILEGAVETMREHHPNERVWVESHGEPSQETPSK